MPPSTSVRIDRKMAPSSNKFLFIVVVIAAFAVQPSAARKTAAAAAPAPAGGKVAQPKSLIPPLFPCIPGLPKLPFIPCYPVWSPEPVVKPTDCWQPLTKLVPCAGFLANYTRVSEPPSACCDGYTDLVGSAGICLCHYSNGDVAKILKVQLNFTRAFALSPACGSHIRAEAFAHCNAEGIPPMTPPNPPPAPTGKAPRPA
ncbi:hypothetical protein ACP70R_014996 [Stipagrostis hirtigluma subsp. patula]